MNGNQIQGALRSDLVDQADPEVAGNSDQRMNPHICSVMTQFHSTDGSDTILTVIRVQGTHDISRTGDGGCRVRSLVSISSSEGDEWT